MKSKQEQVERSREVIGQQAVELIQKYGWDRKVVESKATQLFIHAKKEIEGLGDFEDLSECWDLAIFNNDISWSVKGSYEDKDKSNIVQHVIYKFNYIQDTPIKSLEVFLVNQDDNDMVILGDKETKIGMKVSVADIIAKVEKVGEYEAAKALYNLFTNYVMKHKEK